MKARVCCSAKNSRLNAMERLFIQAVSSTDRCYTWWLNAWFVHIAVTTTAVTVCEHAAHTPPVCINSDSTLTTDAHVHTNRIVAVSIIQQYRGSIMVDQLDNVFFLISPD